MGLHNMTDCEERNVPGWMMDWPAFQVETGQNNRIKTIKRMTYGYRNMENFRLKILAANSKGTGAVFYTY
jgi:hypothetical protein